MFKQFHDWLENRRVKKMGFTTAQWESAIADWPVMRRYQGSERDSLRELTFRFLVRKSIVSGGDFQFSDAMCLKIATMACVPILHLGLDWYDHWYTVILYEGDFVPNRPYRSEDGVVHPRGPGLSGEAWLRGPVILSWESVLKTDAHTRHGKAGICSETFFETPEKMKEKMPEVYRLLGQFYRQQPVPLAMAGM